MGTLIFVDCEGRGPAPGPLHNQEDFEFGAVELTSRASFHGCGATKETFQNFAKWLEVYDRPVFVSDNPAYDWQFINYYFHLYLGRNPFGHSARRIGDYYAGLCGNLWETQRWKRLRITKHDHSPEHDAPGNLEAFERIMAGER